MQVHGHARPWLHREPGCTLAPLYLSTSCGPLDRWPETHLQGAKGIWCPRQHQSPSAARAHGAAKHTEGLVSHSSWPAPDQASSHGKEELVGAPFGRWRSGPHYPAEGPLFLPGLPDHRIAAGPEGCVQENHQGGHPLRPWLPEAVVSGACSPYPSDAGSRQTAPSHLSSLPLSSTASALEAARNLFIFLWDVPSSWDNS